MENCGCNSGMHPEWNQAWRRPLREAMDWLRDTLAALYEEQSKEFFKDSWKARDEYINVILDRTAEHVEGFFSRNAVKELSREEKVKVLKLLELQRNAMLMYTSCGWFFDEISGIETTQVLRYAARTLQLAEELFAVALEKEFLQRLEKAPSNIPEFEHGAKIYEMFVKPSMLDLLRVGAHYAISSLFEEYPESTRIYCYTAESDVYDKTEAGRIRLAIGKTRVKSEITWEEEPISFAVLHLGDHNLNGGVRQFMGEEVFSAMHGEIKETFNKGNISDVIKLMDKHFGTNNYSLWHLFKDEQRKVLNQVLRPILEGIEVSFRKIFEESHAIMNFLHGLQMPIPKPLTAAAEYVINSDLKKVLGNGELNTEKMENLVSEIRKWSLKIDKEMIRYVATAWINSFMERLSHQPEEMALLGKIEVVLKSLNSLSIDVDLWKAQNICFSIGKALGKEMNERVERRDDSARTWIETYRQLCSHLHVNVL
jgi:alpha-amylase/alpha-mannosidase (GH57 family)